MLSIYPPPETALADSSRVRTASVRFAFVFLLLYAAAPTVWATESIATIHGWEVFVPEGLPHPWGLIEGPQDLLEIEGALDANDFLTIDNSYIELYQVTFLYDSRVDIRLDSSEMEPFLWLTRVDSTQQLIVTLSGDDSGTGANARITADLQAGTYWIGINTFDAFETGAYRLVMDSSTLSRDSSLPTVPTRYGVSVQQNPNPYIRGELRFGDFVYDGRFVDLYQFEASENVVLRIDLTSDQFDTRLMLVDVLPDGSLGSLFVLDEDGGESTNARIAQTFGPGTYFMVATSAVAGAGGDYAISVSVDTSPTWVFAGDVPDSERAAFREELEYVRAYFYEEFGALATGFTILVGADYESLSPAYLDAVGTDLSGVYHPEANTSSAWVTSSATGGAVLTLIYGSNENSFLSLLHIVAHEYFHVLQGQLASGFAEVRNGEIGWWSDNTRMVPGWLVEGLASYADYIYTPTRPGRRAFDSRYAPFEDLASAQIGGKLDFSDLAPTADNPDARCSDVQLGDVYCYALSFAAAKFLAEQVPAENAFVEFWGLLGERSAWQQAFSEAFGITVDDFYLAFEQWLPSQIPSFDVVTIQMLWPDMAANPLPRGEFLYLWPEDVLSPNSKLSIQTGALGLWDPTLYLRIVLGPAGTEGSALLSLWWSDDQLTEHRLGWYSDGELTDRKSHATRIEFTGDSYGLEWNIPAHPNSLPRLECRRRATSTSCDALPQ